MLWRASQYGNNNKIIADTNTSSVTKASDTSQSSPKKEDTTVKDTTNNQTASAEKEEPIKEVKTKPYKIDTIAKADIKYDNDNHQNISDCMTTDGSAIYCYEKDNGIYKIDISSGKKEKVIDLEKWFSEQKEKEENNPDNIYNNDWKFGQIYYSKNQNSVYVMIRINKIGNCLFTLSGDSLELQFKNAYYGSMLCDMANGETFTGYGDGSCVVNLSTGEMKQLSLNRIYKAIEKDEKLYYISNSYNVCSYDFVQGRTIFSFDGGYSEEGYFGDTYIFTVYNNAINKYTYAGTKKTGINFSDVEVKDSSDLTSDTRIKNIFILPNENIVIYDSIVGAFRLISKNS